MAGSRRAAVLELAILGLLHEAPLHGYELRRRLSTVLGAARVVSFGSLYPTLQRLVDRGWIGQQVPQGTGGLTGRRSRITYELTATGKEEFQTLLDQAGPTAWEDDTFAVHFAFFSRASSDVRLRILEGRRSRLEERLDAQRQVNRDRRARRDAWTAELHRHGLESTEREVRWLSELIETERTAYRSPPGTSSDGRSPQNPQPP